MVALVAGKVRRADQPAVAGYAVSVSSSVIASRWAGASAAGGQADAGSGSSGSGLWTSRGGDPWFVLMSQPHVFVTSIVVTLGQRLVAAAVAVRFPHGCDAEGLGRPVRRVSKNAGLVNGRPGYGSAGQLSPRHPTAGMVLHRERQDSAPTRPCIAETPPRSAHWMG